MPSSAAAELQVYQVAGGKWVARAVFEGTVIYTPQAATVQEVLSRVGRLLDARLSQKAAAKKLTQMAQEDGYYK